MRLEGLAVVLAALTIPGYWFYELAAQHNPSAMLSQYLGAAALVAMALAQVLATRLTALERLFGGLDRIYVLHKWLGIGAIGALLLHDAIGAKSGRSRSKTWLTELGKELGEVTLDGLIVLVLVSILTIIPYRLWYWSHKLMGAVFAAGALHFVLVRKPFALTDPVAVYVMSFCLLGVLAWLYTLLPIGRSLARRRYVIRTIEPAGDAIAVTLAPQHRGLVHRAGQFAFLSFDVPGLRETHPFTISSPPASDGALRFSIKPLGDFTRRLGPGLAVGQAVRISGPHGRFLQQRRKGPDVWIAGGIGVAPFVAWAGTLANDAGPIHMFYCVRGLASAAHLDELQATAARVPGFRLHLIDSSSGARLTAAQIAQVVGGGLAEAHVSFCGPKAMRNDLRRDLVALGLKGRRFHDEEFEIRTGIGFLERLVVRGVAAARQVLSGRRVDPVRPAA